MSTITPNAALPTADVAAEVVELRDMARTLKARCARVQQALQPTPPRSLHAICEDARRGQCDYCSAMPGEPCAFSGTGPDGYHIARFTWAMGQGLISGPDLAAVLDTAVVFTNTTVIYDDQSGGAR